MKLNGDRRIHETAFVAINELLPVGGLDVLGCLLGDAYSVAGGREEYLVQDVLTRLNGEVEEKIEIV